LADVHGDDDGEEEPDHDEHEVLHVVEDDEDHVRVEVERVESAQVVERVQVHDGHAHSSAHLEVVDGELALALRVVGCNCPTNTNTRRRSRSGMGAASCLLAHSCAAAHQGHGASGRR
jgi:hypothetical protein